MYVLTRQLLGAAGFEQYEISNWARPGQASRHNLTYWRDGQWIGLGAGAASSYAGRRWKNTPVLERYIASITDSGVAARVEDEVPDRLTQMLDYLTLGLRLREGVSLDAFARRFGVELFGVLGEQAPFLFGRDVLRRNGDRLTIDSDHQMITNEVLVHIEEALEKAYVRRETSASQMAAR
jgi:oxygen-independent coproporphyrinogen-3 oxidase